MIEVFSYHLCTEQTDSSLQVSFILLVALLQELKGPFDLKAHCTGKGQKLITAF